MIVITFCYLDLDVELLVFLKWKRKTWRKRIQIFNLLLETTGGTDPEISQGVCLEDIALVEKNVRAGTFVYDIDDVHGSMIGVLVWRSVWKQYFNVRLSRYTCHLCYVSKMNVLFKTFCSLCWCDQFIKRSEHRKTFDKLWKKIRRKFSKR